MFKFPVSQQVNIIILKICICVKDIYEFRERKDAINAFCGLFCCSMTNFINIPALQQVLSMIPLCIDETKVGFIRF
jgi:hypothetical protein